jgi:hypothetical protein
MFITTGFGNEIYDIDSELTVAWLDEGTMFTAEDYDGSESLRTSSDLMFKA